MIVGVEEVLALTLQQLPNRPLFLSHYPRPFRVLKCLLLPQSAEEMERDETSCVRELEVVQFFHLRYLLPRVEQSLLIEL